MDPKTQRRGPADTSSSRFAKLLAVSLILHLPFTPWAALVGLLSLWSPPAEDIEAPPITTIPVDLFEDPEPPAPAEPAPPETAPDNAGPSEPVVAKPKSKPQPEPAKMHDAGAPDAEPPDAAASDAGSDAGLVAADAGAQRAVADAGPVADAGQASDAGARPIREPVLVGSVKQVADTSSNVRLYIYSDKIRQSPLAPRIGPLLRSLYQWREFFGPTGIDPIRDIDQIMFYGEQLRDTSKLVAILQHHVSPANMHTAIDLLVRADHAGGMWLDAPLPAASVHLDGAEHRFILSNAQTIIMTTPEAYKSALAAGKLARLSSHTGPEALSAYVVTPWRVFIGLPIEVPHTIKWARVRVTATPDGGASAEVEAEDESAAQASEDADYLSRVANGLSQLNLGFLGSLLGQQSHKFIEHVTFSSDGKMIRGSAQATAAQLSSGLDLASAFLADRNTRHQAPRAPSAPSARP